MYIHTYVYTYICIVDCLQQSVAERALAVVHVGDDAEVPKILLIIK